MRVVPILTLDDFRSRVEIGTTKESIDIEFKGTYNVGNDEQRNELRKDVVSLANTWGGALLIGIREGDADGYKVASGFHEFDVEAMLGWIANTLAQKTFPLIQRREVVISVPNAAHFHRVIAVNVEPHLDVPGCFQRKDGSLCYPHRSDYGVILLPPAEVFRMQGNKHRRICLSLARLEAANKQIEIVSPVIRQRRESTSELKLRLKQMGSGAQWSGPNPPDYARPQLMEVSAAETVAVVEAFDEDRMSIRFPGRPLLQVPLGLIREVWENTSDTMGVVLDSEIVLPEAAAQRPSIRVR